MYKVININLGGRIFHLEENAFEALSNYINSLKHYFGNQPEGAEIVTDIEHRIAELLQNKLSTGKINCNLDDVSEIIASIGSPKDIAGDESSDASAFESKTEQADFNRNNNTKSKVYRDPDGKVISGVCSGLGYYFDLDSTIVRLIFIALLFAGGTSVFIYIILWIVIPEAKTTAEKLAMKKEKINIDTIRKSVEEEFGKIKGTIENADVKQRVSGLFQKIFHVIALIIKAAFSFISKFIGLIFAIVAVAIFIGMISLITGTTMMNGVHFGIFDTVYLNFFDDANDRLLSQIAILLCLFSMVLVFFNMSRALLSGNKNFANRKFFNRLTGTLTILSIVLFTISGAKTASYFRSKSRIENKIILYSNIKTYTIQSDYSHNHGFIFFNDNDSLKLRNIKLIIESTDGQPELLQISESRGYTADMAKRNAAGCSYKIVVKDSILIFPESFTLKNNQAFRNQKLIFVLKLPVGTSFNIAQNVNIHVGSTFDSDDVLEKGKVYQVKSNGMDCKDCNSFDEEISNENEAYNFTYHLIKCNRLLVSSTLKIKIMKGNQTILKARGIDNQSDLVVDENNGELDIHLKNSFFNHLNDDIELLLITPDLNNIRIQGAVEAEIIGFNKEGMEIFCSGASKCHAKISPINLNLELEGAGEFEVEGSTENFNALIGGACKLEASEFMANHVILKASGASNAEVYAGKTMKANVKGASNVYYSGNPGVTEFIVTGAGKIAKKD